MSDIKITKIHRVTIINPDGKRGLTLADLEGFCVALREEGFADDTPILRRSAYPSLAEATALTWLAVQGP